jgi:hypothetical protein
MSPAEIIAQVRRLLDELADMLGQDGDVTGNVTRNVTGSEYRAKARERLRKFRARRNVSCNVSKKVSPSSPKKGPPDPLKESPRLSLSKKDLVVSASISIWQAAPLSARKRSSQKKLVAAVALAADAGADLQAMQRGCKALYADRIYAGQFAKAVDRVVRDELWRSFAEITEPADYIEQARLQFINGDNPLEASHDLPREAGPVGRDRPAARP